MVTRREFLTQAGAAGGALWLGQRAAPLWAQAAAAAEAGADQPLLVVVELDGGNDGLNTVIPYADDIYQRCRPTLRFAADKVLKLDDHLGLHPAMTGLHQLWDAGQLCVVNNVGYPQPNRSHSAALDIWRSGSLPVQVSGWLGRAADQYPLLSLCHIGDGSIPLAMRQRLGAAMSISDLADFQLRMGSKIVTSEPQSPDSAVEQIAARFQAAGALATRMSQPRAPAMPAAGKSAGGNQAEQPAPLAERLKLVRQLMEQDAGFRIYYTGTTGFDTHANQGFRHRRLLGEVSDAIAGFLKEIQASALGNRVVVLVFSEFGRRLSENGQQGTDHGAAAPVLLVGKPVRGGMLGGYPDLQHLDGGDVAYKIDYRDLYASLLKRWLAVDPTAILGQRDTSLAVV